MRILHSLRPTTWKMFFTVAGFFSMTRFYNSCFLDSIVNVGNRHQCIDYSAGKYFSFLLLPVLIYAFFSFMQFRRERKLSSLQASNPAFRNNNISLTSNFLKTLKPTFWKSIFSLMTLGIISAYLTLFPTYCVCGNISGSSDVPISCNKYSYLVNWMGHCHCGCTTLTNVILDYTFLLVAPVGLYLFWSLKQAFDRTMQKPLL